MQVKINGRLKEFEKEVYLKELIAHLCINPAAVVAEINGEIVSRSLWEKKLINNNDIIELVTFVGGG